MKVLKVGIVLAILTVTVVLENKAFAQLPLPNPIPASISSSTFYGDVGKWKRFEVSFTDSSWSGNPFDVEFQGVFTHTSSGRTLTQFGFYAGNNTWKIYFMPDRLDEWTFVTNSTDPDLDGQTGSFNCIPSNLPGRLIGEGNRWKLEDNGEYVAPILIPTRQWFKSTNTNDGIDDFILWADTTVGAQIVGTTLVYFGHSQNEVPYVKGQEGETFNLDMWDRMNDHYDMLRDREMGHYIMFYSDDAESPNNYGITEFSEAELRLFRYVVARFSAYPMVIWDTGIDINETRSNAWIDWFANWFNANDPWQHPVSSRTGGGSGGKFPDNGTYYSDGTSTFPSHNTVANDWSNRNVPTAYTDRWRENYSRGNFDRDKIRRAAWEVGLVGGTAIYVSGNENGGYLTDTYATDFEAAPDLGHRTNFFENTIFNLGSLSPHPELVTSGSNVVLVAVLDREYVVYDFNGGSIGIDLTHATGTLDVQWFNPRSGQFSGQTTTQGGGIRNFNAPFTGDAVLHITRDVDTTPATAPQNLVTAANGPFQIDLSWTAATDPESGIRYYKIYRDGMVVGQTVDSKPSTFSDKGLFPETTYAYQVTAINGAGLVSEKSNVGTATTEPAQKIFLPIVLQSVVAIFTILLFFGFSGWFFWLRHRR